MDYILRDINIAGGVTNLNVHSNGNIYFSLKDKYARIDAMASRDDVNIQLFDGAKVMAKGTVTYYDRSGRIFLYVSEIELDGRGNLYQKYLELKEKLSKEGLFDYSHKKKIKRYPSSIGLITSTSGAAIKDVINLFRKRNKSSDIYVFPSLVQGESASENLIRGIKYFNEKEKVDTIIIARGGGSFEDLFVFNDENLAREIFASKIPIISAVGHEVDFTICDFVADLRAATPTNAAELSTISEDELKDYLLKKEVELNNLIEKRLNLSHFKLLSIYKNISLKNQFYKINSMTRDLLYRETLLNNSMKKILQGHSYELQNKKFYLQNFKLNKSKEIENYSYRLKNISVKLSSKISKNRENLNFNRKLLSYYFKTKINDEFKKFKAYEKFILDYDLDDRLKSERDRLKYLNIRLKSAFDKINKIEILTEDGQELKAAKDARLGEIISLKFKDGNIKSKVQNVEMRD